MRNLWQDIRYAARVLRKAPGFTFVAVLALALGIGANTAIFPVIDAVLLRPLPFKDSESLVAVNGFSAREPEARAPMSYPDMLDFKTQAGTIAHVAAYQQIGTALVIGDEPTRLLGADVTADIFPMLGVRPELGRVFTEKEDAPGAEPVIVISHDLWQRAFDRDPGVIGRTVRRGDRNLTIIGVMPRGFKFPVQAEKVEFWTPLVAGLARTNPSALTNRDSRFLPTVAKLKPGVILEAAQAEIDALARRIEEQNPATHTGSRVRLVPMQRDLVGDVRPALLVLCGAVGFVLLIACANVANLLLARSAARRKEIAVRTALGASRWRVVRQLLTESLLLALAGGACGSALAWWGVDLLASAIPPDIPRAADINLDSRVLVFTFAVSILTGVVFGLAPALSASRLDFNERLKEGGRGSTEGGRGRVRNLLVVSEVALSIVLLVGAGLLVKSFFRLLDADPGYDTANVLSVTLPLSKSKYAKPEQQIAFIDKAVERTGALPGVEAAGATNLLPLGRNDVRNTFDIAGRPPAAPGERPAARSQIATADYFRAMNIPLRRGRAFTGGDTQTAPPVILINDTLARTYFPDRDPIGERLVLDGESNDPLPPREIVGVVGSVRFNGFDEEEYPEYYVPFAQAPDTRMTLVARARKGTDPASLAPAVRAVIKEIDPAQLIWEMRTMSERVRESVAPRRFTMTLLGVFALIALVLASVGIYGVMSYVTAQRTHEIGIRMALGARKADVLRLIVGRGLRLVLVGTACGLVAGAALTRLMTSLLYGVSAYDPLVFGGVSALLLLVAALACYVPARRATKIDPMIALRYE